MNLLSFLCPEGAVTDHSHMQELFLWWGFLFSTWNLSAADARKVCAFMSLTGWFLHTSFRTSSCFAGVLTKSADLGKSSLCQLGFSQRHSYWLIHTWVKHKTENWLDFFLFQLPRAQGGAAQQTDLFTWYSYLYVFFSFDVLLHACSLALTFSHVYIIMLKGQHVEA